MASSTLNDLLRIINAHPGYQELLTAVPRPRVTRYSPSASLTLEQVGAKASYESGKIDQDNAWRTLLTGDDYATKE